ncbi:hypothetical protein PG996_012239 [Apiospora saccharicola]|uniref:Rhodopsin domain-containing protein n=1 Tax=Apiospora saccharicola TaxID=335842 RepID=A0ABR1U4R0_9PEZI
MTTVPHQGDLVRAAETNRIWLFGVTIAIHILAWIFCILRMYTRLVLVRSFGKDDVLMIASLVFVCGGGMTTLLIAGTKYGWGRHFDTLTQQQKNGYLMMMAFHGIFSSITAFGFLKLSIAFSLLRLNGKEGYWDKTVQAKCISLQKFNMFAYTNTFCNIFTDFAFATLPIPMIWRLQMPTRARVYLLGIFSMGYLTISLGVLKVVFQMAPSLQTSDRTFIDFPRFWGFLEGNMGICVACAPTLKRLVGGRLKINTHNSPGSSRYGSGGSHPPSHPFGSKDARARRSGYIQTNGEQTDRDGKPADENIELNVRNTTYRQREKTDNALAADSSHTGYDRNVVTSAWPTHLGSPSGSEDTLLGGETGTKGSILRTTEVTVHHDD